MAWRLSTTFRSWLNGPRARRANVAAPARRLSVESLETRRVLSAATESMLAAFGPQGFDAIGVAPSLGAAFVGHPDHWVSELGPGAGDDHNGWSIPAHSMFGGASHEDAQLDFASSLDSASVDRGPATVVMIIFRTQP